MSAATNLLDIALLIAFAALAIGQILSMVLGIQQGVQIYFEVTLLIAMLGFVSTVALARFLLRGDIIE